MKRQATPSSSNIKSVGYEAGILEIEFIVGSVYQYNVPESVYTALMAAESVGKFFSANIRKQYTGTRV